MHIKIHKKSFLPVVMITLSLMLCVPVFAAAICGRCGEYGSVRCTGEVIPSEYTHYEHQLGFIHWGWECTYYPPRHDVRTDCCNASWGGHIYEDYIHPVCGQLEEEFPCNKVPDWVMDP